MTPPAFIMLLKGVVSIFTLGQIKARIWMMLEEYTRDGSPAEINHTHLADIRQRMPDMIDTVQRKIALCGRRKKCEQKLIFTIPQSIGETVYDAYISEGLRITVPEGARAYSLTLRGGDAVAGFLSLSEDEEAQEVLLESRCLVCDWGEEKRHTGFVPQDAQSMSLKGEGGLKELVFYSSAFPEQGLIPPVGYTSCSLPTDIMSKRSFRREGTDIEYTDMEECDGVLFIRGEGDFILTYERYPHRVDIATLDDVILELDDICCDALVYGVAAGLCPLSQGSLYLKLRGMFEEAMANLYNAYPLGGRISNTFFATKRRRGGI